MKRTSAAEVAFGLMLLLLSWGYAATAGAQAAQLTTDVGPHYVGEAVSVRVTAVGFDEDPVPTAEVAPPANGSLELVAVSPSVSQSITIVNGRMSRTREVTHVFQFRYLAAREGNVALGPFRISQGTRVANVDAVRLAVRGVPSSNDLSVALQVPPGPLFVGERVPVSVTFMLEQGLQKNVLEYALHVPLFDEPAFRFLDEGHEGDMQVTLQTQAGQLELRGRSGQQRKGNKLYTTVTLTRTLIALEPGSYAIRPTSLSVEEGVRFRRDIFRGRQATQVRRWVAKGSGSRLEVGEIPGQARPPSFAGGIGRGFNLEVSADRTVVQVGDPITLSLVLRGEGLETASLPPLDAEGLLSPREFRVPEGSPTGEVDGDSKRFTAVVRVLVDGVAEIPSLAYSWFDPEAREYRTTHSRPIALSVRSAEVIGARDVEVTQEPGEKERASSATLDPRPRSFALTGADLAVERDPSLVLAGAASWGGARLPETLYAGSVVLLLAALWDRRRRRADPVLARRGRVLAEELAKVKAAQTISEIGRSLRRMLREVPTAASAEVDAFLGECDARSYAPSSTAIELEPAFREQAAQIAEAIVEASR